MKTLFLATVLAASAAFADGAGSVGSVNTPTASNYPYILHQLSSFKDHADQIPGHIFGLSISVDGKLLNGVYYIADGGRESCLLAQIGAKSLCTSTMKNGAPDLNMAAKKALTMSKEDERHALDDAAVALNDQRFMNYMDDQVKASRRLTAIHLDLNHSSQNDSTFLFALMGSGQAGDVSATVFYNANEKGESLPQIMLGDSHDAFTSAAVTADQFRTWNAPSLVSKVKNLLGLQDQKEADQAKSSDEEKRFLTGRGKEVVAQNAISKGDIGAMASRLGDQLQAYQLSGYGNNLAQQQVLSLECSHTGTDNQTFVQAMHDSNDKTLKQDLANAKKDGYQKWNSDLRKSLQSDAQVRAIGSAKDIQTRLEQADAMTINTLADGSISVEALSQQGAVVNKTSILFKKGSGIIDSVDSKTYQAGENQNILAETSCNGNTGT